MDTKIETVKIGELELQPLTLGTITTLAKIGSTFIRQNPEGTALPVSLQEIAVAALVFAKPAWCHQMMKSNKRDEVLQAAEELSFELDAPTLQSVMSFINSSLADFFTSTRGSKPTEIPAE